MPNHLAGLFWSQLSLARWATAKNFENRRISGKSRLYKQPLHPSSNLLDFNLLEKRGQRKQKNTDTVARQVLFCMLVHLHTTVNWTIEDKAPTEARQ